MSDVGRELDYLHWNKDDLVKALIQAEDDLKDLKADLENLQDERDQYYEESRRSTEQLGGIIQILRDNDVDPRVNPARGGDGRPVRQRTLPEAQRFGWTHRRGRDLCEECAGKAER